MSRDPHRTFDPKYRDQLIAGEAEFGVRRLVAQCDAYRARIRALEQAPSAQPTVHALLVDPHVNAGNAYIRFRTSSHGAFSLLGVNPQWGAWWCMPEQAMQADDYADPGFWEPTQSELEAVGEVVPASTYRKPVDIPEDSPLPF